ncbi:MAG: hypothetical protein U0325_27725 [Polyangiales bacterium]
MRALPILVGAALRVPFGMLADRLGARVGAQALVTVQTAAELSRAQRRRRTDRPRARRLAARDRRRGAAVAVQSVAAATPAERRGFALGLLGAGDVGAAVTLALMPAMLAEHGWRDVRGCAVVVALTGALFVGAVSRDAPSLGARSVRRTCSRRCTTPRAGASGSRSRRQLRRLRGARAAGPALLVDAFGCTRGAAR